MVLLVDTDVTIDFLISREPFCKLADMVFALCASRTCEGLLAFHTLPNIFYILRKDVSVSRRLELLGDLTSYMRVVSACHDGVRRAISKSEDRDFEDALQIQCAIEHGADYIVTRNTKHFWGSPVPYIEPADLMIKLKSGEIR